MNNEDKDIELDEVSYNFRKTIKLVRQLEEELERTKNNLWKDGLPKYIEYETGLRLRDMAIPGTDVSSPKLMERYKQDSTSARFVLMTPEQIEISQLRKRVAELEKKNNE